MGKICGFVASSGSQATLDTRQLLRDSHSVEGPADFTDFYFHDDSAALAAEGSESFHRDDHNGFACLVDAYFSHYDRIVDDFAEQGVDIRACSPAEAVLLYYRNKPIQSLKLLRGSFVFAIWNGRQGQLVLGRDRYGTGILPLPDPGGVGIRGNGWDHGRRAGGHVRLARHRFRTVPAAGQRHGRVLPQRRPGYESVGGGPEPAHRQASRGLYAGLERSDLRRGPGGP